MSAPHEAEKLLSVMSRGEGTTAAVGSWVLGQARRLGAGEAELLRSYPTLRAEDLANAWAYVGSHRDEIEEQIRESSVR